MNCLASSLGNGVQLPIMGWLFLNSRTSMRLITLSVLALAASLLIAVRQCFAQATSFPPESLIPDFDRPLPSVSSVPGSTDRCLGQTLPLGQTEATLIEQRTARLERSVFGTIYAEHDLSSRLQHLEIETFGTSTSGNFEERLVKLEAKIGGSPAFEGRPSGSVNQESLSTKSRALGADHDVSTIVESIPANQKVGDYFTSIHSMDGRFARWNKFPVRLHMPQESPESWGKNLVTCLKRWSQCVPLSMVPAAEAADIDVTWVNHLTPGLLGITRVLIEQGHMHVQIFMLRPTFYPSVIPEPALLPAFLHELGHGLGLLGHSDSQADCMYPIGLGSRSRFSSGSPSISDRDINTLKKVYRSPAIESDYTAPAPMEWGSDKTGIQGGR